MKIVDRCAFQLLIGDKVVAEHDGYVPDFFPEEHYGDYIEFEIDIDTGQILNWKVPTKKELKEQLNDWK